MLGRRDRTDTLPAETSSFVGREAELGELRRLLRERRLVTLTGAGGVGKSRLALRAAAQAADEFRDGVRRVELSTLRDPDLLPHVVASALRLQDQTTRPMQDVLASYVGDRSMLLLLDGCEPVVDACAALVVQLLRAAPNLTVLTTSRELLGVLGEQVFAVTPLAIAHPGSPTDARPGDAVVLFTQRARAANPKFRLDDSNRSDVEALCHRLDGLPLALELAAGRTRELTIAQMTAGLSDRFALLSRDPAAEPRHQTLRGAVGWSHELCEPRERLLWARLSVFPGDFDLHAVERICADDHLPAEELLELIGRLADKSIVLVGRDQDESRYRMLDTVRDFGSEWLDALGETEALRSRHLTYYLDLAERFDADWFGPNEPAWNRRIRTELTNIRAALRYCSMDGHRRADGIRLAGALHYYWMDSSTTREGLNWLSLALAGEQTEPTTGKLRGLASASMLSYIHGDHAAAETWARDCLRQARELADPLFEARALTDLANGTLVRDGGAAVTPLHEQALALFARHARDDPFAAFAMAGYSAALQFAGDLERSREIADQCVTFCSAHGDVSVLGLSLGRAAHNALARGQPEQAAALAKRSLALRDPRDDSVVVALPLEYLAWTAADGKDYDRAARLFGVADERWRRIGRAMLGNPEWLRRREHYETLTRAALGDRRFDAAHHVGSQLSLAEAIADALSPSPSSASWPPSQASQAD